MKTFYSLILNGLVLISSQSFSQDAKLPVSSANGQGLVDVKIAVGDSCGNVDINAGSSANYSAGGHLIFRTGTGSSYPGDALFLFGQVGSSFGQFRIGTSTNNTPIRIFANGDITTTGGRMIIKTSTPSSKISIRNVGGTDGVKLLDLSELDDEEFIFKGNFAGTGSAGNKLVLGSGITNWQQNIMTWTGDGKIGVGTSLPSSKLSIRNVGGTDGVKLMDFSELDDEEFIFKGNFAGTGSVGNKLVLGSGITNWQQNIMTWTGDGKIGVGTSLPSSKLSIRNVGGTDGVKLMDFSEVDDEEFIIKGNFVGTGSIGNKLVLGSGLTDWQQNIMTWTGDGKVGIGTSSPDNALHILSTDWQIKFQNLVQNGNSWYMGIRENKKFVISHSVSISTNGPGICIDSSENVGIGTKETQGYRLAVGGGILCEEVMVQTDVPNSDYVFNPSYKLRSLNELETYVKTNNHLPEVPSSKDFKQNGYKVGQMDDILLRKIEELTLYVIELKKENEEINAKNIELNAKIEKLIK
jgi:hypothetical protein